MYKFLKILAILTVTISLSVQYANAQSNRNLPNVATLYNPSLSTIHPKFTVFHKNDNISTIFAYINLKELNFVKLADRNNKAKVKFKFIFYESLEGTTIIDSLSEVYEFNYQNINQSIVLSFDMNMPNQNCKLVIITTDLYQLKNNINFLTINKNPKSSQNLILIDSVSNSAVFEKFVKPYKTYTLKSKNQTDSFFIEKYIINDQVAPPPYSNSTPAYTLSHVENYKVNSNSSVKFSENFVYKITSLSDSSFTYYSCFDEYFPGVFVADQMVNPLKYLTSSAEFNDITLQNNKKIAIDNFWLNKNNNRDNARKLIKFYYNRVVYSNNKFTTTKKGWMTDRGMIYIIFGPPNYLFVGDDFQEWRYYNKSNGKKINFVFFRKLTSDFSTDYILKRNQNYILDWQNAIETWNNGHFFTF